MPSPAELLRERLARTKRKQEETAAKKIESPSVPCETTVSSPGPAKTPAPPLIPKSKKATKPKPAGRKPVKTLKPRVKPKPKVKQKKAKPRPKKVVNDKPKTADRDVCGDGLRPIERKIINAVAKSDGELGILDIAHDMFGPKCRSEGPNSVRTVRNAVRIPIRYGIIERSGRGHLCVSKEYAKSSGDLKYIVSTYKETKKAVAA